jgi:hypothetical protein
MLGSNHRRLARALVGFPTHHLAVRDALVIAGLAPAATIEVSIGADTTWHWVLLVDDEPRAASAVPYARRLECLRAVARFRECAPLAVIDPEPLVRRAGDRPHRRERQSPV